eukprot:3808883-Rhodomonas_salina.3
MRVRVDSSLDIEGTGKDLESMAWITSPTPIPLLSAAEPAVSVRDRPEQGPEQMPALNDDDDDDDDDDDEDDDDDLEKENH